MVGAPVRVSRAGRSKSISAESKQTESVLSTGLFGSITATNFCRVTVCHEMDSWFPRPETELPLGRYFIVFEALQGSSSKMTKSPAP